MNPVFQMSLRKAFILIKNIWRTFLVCLILILTSGAGASPLAERGPEAQLYPLTLITHSGAHAFEVEIADTPEATTRGLMFRRELAPDFGMLFDFHAPQPQSFWMKNTYVSLDMVFIGVDDGAGLAAAAGQMQERACTSTSISTRVPARTLANPTARRPNMSESHSETRVLEYPFNTPKGCSRVL